MLLAVFLFYLLLFAHLYINGVLIPNNLRLENVKVWKAISLVILCLEFSALSLLLGKFNRWYCDVERAKLAGVATSLVVALDGGAILFWVLNA